MTPPVFGGWCSHVYSWVYEKGLLGWEMVFYSFINDLKMAPSVGAERSKKSIFICYKMLINWSLYPYNI